MPGIDARTIKRHLSVDSWAKKVGQKLRSFSMEKYMVIADKVNCLLVVGFIMEV